MKTRGGGTAGAWHLGAVRKYMDQMYGGNMQIEETGQLRGMKYRVTDTYRPGVIFEGRTPRLAAQAAGCHIIGLSR